MRKKFMMVAVLLGALTLGACVDDNESQSVTDVRTAKAEQLRAMADLYKAQAEAELIYANAEKPTKKHRLNMKKQELRPNKLPLTRFNLNSRKLKKTTNVT